MLPYRPSLIYIRHSCNPSSENPGYGPVNATKSPFGNTWQQLPVWNDMVAIGYETVHS